MPLPLPKLNDDSPLLLGALIEKEPPPKPAPKVWESGIYHLAQVKGKLTVSALPELLGPRYAPKATAPAIQKAAKKKTAPLPDLQIGDLVLACSGPAILVGWKTTFLANYPRYRYPNGREDFGHATFLQRPDSDGWFDFDPKIFPGNIDILLQGGKTWRMSNNTYTNEETWARSGSYVKKWKPLP